MQNFGGKEGGEKKERVVRKANAKRSFSRGQLTE
jgi:hypothetical protein